MVQTAGGEIVMNAARDKTMVDDLLQFKQRMDVIVSGPFGRRELFVNALKVCASGEKQGRKMRKRNERMCKG